MRIEELFLLVSLLVLIISPRVIHNLRHRLLLSAAIVLLAVYNAFINTIRLVMLPAYLLVCILFLCNAAMLWLKGRKSPLIIRITGITAVSLLYLAACTLPYMMPVVNLPKPSGSSPVGTMRLDFTEPARKNVFTGTEADEKIALTIWYPASYTKGYRQAVWMDKQTARLFGSSLGLPDIFGQFSLVKTHSFWNAPLSDTRKDYPVLLFSGGVGSINSQNTVQMEELASRGYIVCAVSHPGDDYAALYADGTLKDSDRALMNAQQTETEGAYKKTMEQIPDINSPAFQRAFLHNFDRITKAVQVWSGDLIAAADYLETLNSSEGMWKDRLNSAQLGVFGHSFGGAAAGNACLKDGRFKAFANLDGTPFGDTADHTLKQPFLVIMSGKADASSLQVAGYAKNQTNFLVLGVNGAQHMNFMDLNTTLPRLGKLTGLLGKINGSRQTLIVNTYLNAFFDKYLKGEQEPLLDASVSEFSEVTILKK